MNVVPKVVHHAFTSSLHTILEVLVFADPLSADLPVGSQGQDFDCLSYTLTCLLTCVCVYFYVHGRLGTNYMMLLLCDCQNCRINESLW